MNCTQPFNISANFAPTFGRLPSVPTLTAILAAEPRLQQVLDQASAARHLRGRGKWLAYERLKQAAAGFVGWYSQNRRLGGTEHFEVVMAEIARRSGL